MNEQKVDWSKPIQTRDGYKARLIWTGDLGTGFTVEHKRIVAVSSLTCGEFVVVFGEDGKSLSNENKDIINVPEKQYWAKAEHIPNGGNIWITNVCWEHSERVNKLSKIHIVLVSQSIDYGEKLMNFRWSENCCGPWKECLVEDAK